MNNKLLFVFIQITILNGCTLSGADQSKLEQFPECEKHIFRLSQSLNGDEANCVMNKKYLLERENERKKQLEEINNAKKMKAKKLEEYELKRSIYIKSEQGINDKNTCNLLLIKSLESRGYNDFDLREYSRSADNFLSCSALVRYQSLTGHQFKPLTIIYNEINNVMRYYYR